MTGRDETQFDDAASVWRRWATDVRSVELPGGHFVPEEAGEALAATLFDVFRGSA